MSFVNGFQERQLPVFSESRKKLDRVQSIEIMNTQHMENAKDILWHGEDETLQCGSKCDLRKSLAWDSAFFTSPGVLDQDELFQTVNFRNVDNETDITGHMKQTNVPSDSFEPERKSRLSDCSIRRSLAWDSAFFTSAGVLDPEELSIINKGFEKPEIHLLPGIEEEIWRSAESSSTIESDRYSLASLEIDLFDDLRASIHKSSKVSNGATSSRTGLQTLHSSITMDVSSQARLKPAPASKRQNVNTYESNRIAKDASVPQRTQHVAQSGENLLSVKPPKIVDRASSLSSFPTKRVSLGAKHVEKVNKASKSAAGQHATMPKRACLVDSCSVLPSSTPTRKSPSISPTATNESTAIVCDPCDFPGKTPSSLRRKVDSKIFVSGSATTAPMKYSRNISDTVNWNSPTFLLSTSKPSSCQSPSSSIDGCPSESSLTCENRRSNNSMASPDTTPCSGVYSRASQPSNYESLAYIQSQIGHKNQDSKLSDQCVTKLTVRPSPVSPDNSGNVKPSGLRLPSPKIGFFEVENSKAVTLNGRLQFESGLQSSLFGTNSLSRASNRSRNRKMGTGNLKFGTQQAAVPCNALGAKPTNPGQSEVENLSLQAHALSGNPRSCLPTNSKTQNDFSSKLSSRDCLKTGNMSSSTKTGDRRAQRIRKNKIGMKNEEPVQVGANKQCLKEHGDSLHLTKNNLHVLHANGKENKVSMENQIDDLRRHMEAIDFSKDLVIEPKEKKRPHSPLGMNNSDEYVAPASLGVPLSSTFCG